MLTEFRCLVILFWNRHGNISEKRNKLSLGLDEFRMGWKLAWQCRKQRGWTIKRVFASRPTRCTCTTPIYIAACVLGVHDAYGWLFMKTWMMPLSSFFAILLDSRHDNSILWFTSSSICLMVTRAITQCSLWAHHVAQVHPRAKIIPSSGTLPCIPYPVFLYPASCTNPVQLLYSSIRLRSTASTKHPWSAPYP